MPRRLPLQPARRLCLGAFKAAPSIAAVSRRVRGLAAGASKAPSTTVSASAEIAEVSVFAAAMAREEGPRRCAAAAVRFLTARARLRLLSRFILAWSFACCSLRNGLLLMTGASQMTRPFASVTIAVASMSSGSK